MNNGHTLDHQRRIARDDDRMPPRQRFADRIERLAPHDHRAPHRELLEAAEVGGQVPGHLAVGAPAAPIHPVFPVARPVTDLADPAGETRTACNQRLCRSRWKDLLFCEHGYDGSLLEAELVAARLPI